MSKKPKAKDKLSRDELLGFEKCFGLNQAEYISRKIIDQLLFLTFQQVRIHNVLALEEEFSVYRAMKQLKQTISFTLIEPEIEYEKNINYDINFELMPNRIDTWASNKTKILRNIPEEELQPMALKKPVMMTKTDKEGMEISSPTVIKKESVMQKISKLARNTEKVVKKNTTLREVALDSKSLHIEQLVQYDEMDQIKLKGYRTYFQEKEIEDKKNKILEEIQKEKEKEEEKKIKQFTQMMNASSLLSWDSNGQFLAIKTLPLPESRDFLQIAPVIIDKQTEYDPDKVFTTAQSIIIKPQGEEIIKDPQPISEIRERFYQPDPISTFDLAKGTSMEFYGKKKQGGNFDKGDGGLSHVDYMELLNQIHPYHFADINLANKPKTKNDGNKNEVIKEEEGGNLSPIAKHSLSYNKLFYMFRDVDDDKLFNDPLDQMRKEQEEILKNLSPKTTKALVGEIKKKQKEAQIKKLKGFKINEINDIANEKIYDIFRYNNDNGPEMLIPFKSTEKIRPPHIHDDNKKSFRSTYTKLLRERRRNDFGSKTSYDHNWIKQKLKQKNKEDKEKKEEKEKQIKENETNKLPKLK